MLSFASIPLNQTRPRISNFDPFKNLLVNSENVQQTNTMILQHFFLSVHALSRSSPGLQYYSSYNLLQIFLLV